MSDPAGGAAPTVSIVSTPTQIDRPALLVNAPFSLSTEEVNNVWMDDYAEAERVVDRPRAMAQFLDLYGVLSAQALVYVLPTPRTTGLQDLPYTANLGIVTGHPGGRGEVVVANFTSVPRRGETAVGVAFFEAMGYVTQVSPYRFEGEADLKHLHGDVYVGGYGIRTERAALDWLSTHHGMRILPVRMTDPRLYHLDCSVFPLDHERTLVCTAAFARDELALLAEHTDVIDVSLASAQYGLCNSVRLGGSVVNASSLGDMRAGTTEYERERAKVAELERIAADAGLEVVSVNLSEFEKSGAMLSCLVMHLNRRAYDPSPP